ncbi:hypothetical protein GCM10009747_13210 [Agromyces humatus]|uniref:Uncharacterized protein n=1 Tax=Agromyces humatus TaxID=279573 RepID=A0ABP4WNR0_9MICO
MQQNKPRPVAWISGTAAAADAWTLGMLPRTIGLDLSSGWVIPTVIIGAVVLVASIPFAQWRVLARPRIVRWIPVRCDPRAVRDGPRNGSRLIVRRCVSGRIVSRLVLSRLVSSTSDPCLDCGSGQVVDALVRADLVCRA